MKTATKDWTLRSSHAYQDGTRTIELGDLELGGLKLADVRIYGPGCAVCGEDLFHPVHRWVSEDGALEWDPTMGRGW